ncbi:hypothetical protein GCM10009682_26380 [Luedemannella flava]|uniref:M23ase beta-sheet core domain-containing protein n=1 Tax=Luedemannella flava TaxID=349316 RepID=A0ABN2LYF6_9ACTN
MPPSSAQPRRPALIRPLLAVPVVALALIGSGAAASSWAASAGPALSARAPDGDVPSGWLSWPLGGSPTVTRGFDPPDKPWLPGHRGVDLAARAGDPVRAAGPGVVVFAGDLAGRGVVSVAHPGGLRTTYEPVDPLVAVGDEVAAGALIGTVSAGHAGCPAAACLHWGARRGDTYLDPLSLLGPPRLRLKPLPGA